jgi:uncharacterized protein GlcG (DUF336 family)
LTNIHFLGEVSVSKTIYCLSAAACFCALSVSAQAQLPVEKVLTYEVASQMASVAVETCVAAGADVSVHVVNVHGETIAAARGDNTRPYTFENSYEKAYTAMAFRRPSADYQADYIAGNQTRVQQADFPNIVAIGGGLPFFVGEEILGGIGVSGGNNATNNGCGQAGIDAVADQLR